MQSGRALLTGSVILTEAHANKLTASAPTARSSPALFTLLLLLCFSRPTQENIFWPEP